MPASKTRSTPSSAAATSKPAATRADTAAAATTAPSASPATRAKVSAAVVQPAKPAPPSAPMPASSPKAAAVVKPAKAAKPPKLRSKPVRDSFTMPEADFALIYTLKARTLAAQRETKKSELLRAGLHALADMDSKALLAALQQLEPVQVGRPKKGK